MSGHHAAHGLEHEVGVECDPDLDGTADVVRVALGVELPEEPQGLLVLRQRVAEFVLVHLHLGRVGVSGLVGDQLGQGVVELCDQLGDRGAAQQGHHWRGDAELGADPGSQFHRQERVESQRVEPGLRVDPVGAGPQYRGGQLDEPPGHQGQALRRVGVVEGFEDALARPGGRLGGGGRRQFGDQAGRRGVPGLENRPVDDRGDEQLGSVLADDAFQHGHADVRRQRAHPAVVEVVVDEPQFLDHAGGPGAPVHAQSRQSECPAVLGQRVQERVARGVVGLAWPW